MFFNLIKLLLVSSLSLLPVLCQVECKNVRFRKEIRELSTKELLGYEEAVRKLHSRKNSAGSTFPEVLANIHVNYFGRIHKSGYFLPWHRYVLRLYEHYLQKENPDIMLPYWDWSIDYIAPHTSAVLSDRYVGGNGDPRRRRCINSGIFKNIGSSVPSYHCVKRKYSVGNYIESFAGPEELESYLNEGRISDFSYYLEIVHGYPHSSIGGDFSESYSNNDPLFYLHHGFIDMLWSEWQKRNPRARFEARRYRTSETADSTMPPFKYRIRDVLNTRSKLNCYDYPRYPHHLIRPGSSSRTLSDSYSKRAPITKLVFNQTSDQIIAKFLKENPSANFDKLVNSFRSNFIDNNHDGIDDREAKNKTSSRALGGHRKLPPVGRLSDKWIKNNGFSIKEVRLLEKKRNALRSILNRSASFIPF